MKSPAKMRKQFILDPRKIKKAQKILHVTTETETIEKALDDLIISNEISKQPRKMAGNFKIEDMDQSHFLG